MGNASRQVCGFAFERPEDLFTRQFRLTAGGGAAGSQVPQPGRQALSRLPQAPAQDQQRDRDNEHSLDQHARQRPSQGCQALRVDVRSIVKDCQRSQHDPRIAAEGKREDVHRLSARFEILTLLRIFFNRKVHCLRRLLQREIRSHGERLTLSVIHRHACQALVILETVHNALQFAIGVPGHQRRDRLLQALRQDQRLPV